MFELWVIKGRNKALLCSKSAIPRHQHVHSTSKQSEIVYSSTGPLFGRSHSATSMNEIQYQIKSSPANQVYR